ncbi:hypothetical protein FCV25MIE_33819 [Fagus crenata]
MGALLERMFGKKENDPLPPTMNYSPTIGESTNVQANPIMTSQGTNCNYHQNITQNTTPQITAIGRRSLSEANPQLGPIRKENSNSDKKKIRESKAALMRTQPGNDPEIKDVISGMGNDKAPRPDGYTTLFFKKSWQARP